MRECEPWLLLAAAIIRRAFRDARRGDGDARRWLEDEGARWLDCMNIDGEAVLFSIVKKAG